MSPAPAPPSPWLLRWQGVLASLPAGPLTSQLPLLSGVVLCALMAGLPLVTRSGLSLLILAAGLLWLLWALRTPAGGLGAINGWLLLVLGLAVVATGCSPVPVAAFKGLLKLVSYLGVYALMRQLLASAPQWWNRIVAALLAGQLLSAVLAIRQLYGDTSELARWADPNSVADGTIRVYGPLENPNLLAGYLIPILPIALVALLRWRTVDGRFVPPDQFIPLAEQADKIYQLDRYVLERVCRDLRAWTDAGLPTRKVEEKAAK